MELHIKTRIEELLPPSVPVRTIDGKKTNGKEIHDNIANQLDKCFNDLKKLPIHLSAIIKIVGQKE